MDESFFTSDIFIRLSFCLYFKSEINHFENEYNAYYNELSNLITVTNLNNSILVHSFYYFYLLINHKSNIFEKNKSFKSSSRLKLFNLKKKSVLELKNLMITLLMLSNKSHDDSSYTLKTWINLTNLSAGFFKKNEIIILKKINYNLFLSNSNYLKFTNILYNNCLKYNLINFNLMNLNLNLPLYSSNLINSQKINKNYSLPLTPNSPLIEIHPSNCSCCIMTNMTNDLALMKSMNL